ncbi:unnamed protein product [Caenorhabditis angaria]|uniref:1-acyl-sn-glycerol-3-phosphate acyltransferase n=1 Tax=Caenorhabditis angaria TaxID=860376 RepID=A0A9P1N6J9_9PELO|nr:unnamed protein product [Caenorhabditis angaria]
MDLWLAILLFFLGFLLVLYNVSADFNYYSRISFFYFTILLHGMVCCVTMIPSWLKTRGADHVFEGFYYWCKWSGVHTTVHNYEGGQIEGSAVVICNHQSSLDILAMCSVWPHRCVVMMKKLLAYVPFFNFASMLACTIFIDRTNRDKAMQSVDYCVSEMKKRDLKLWIFPEGTRNRAGGLMPFKKGAFNIAIRAQLPIIPIVFSDYRPFYSKPGKYFKTNGEIVIEVMEPIPTEGLTLEDVPEFSEKVRQKMLETYERISAEAKNKMENTKKLT